MDHFRIQSSKFKKVGLNANEIQLNTRNTHRRLTMIALNKEGWRKRSSSATQNHQYLNPTLKPLPENLSSSSVLAFIKEIAKYREEGNPKFSNTKPSPTHKLFIQLPAAAKFACMNHLQTKTPSP